MKTRHLLLVGALVAGLAPSVGAATSGTDHEIWIGVRTDGQAGSGTLADPYDGSTQPLFDARLRSYAEVSSLTIHLLPGVFLTKGNYDHIPGFQNRTDGWACNSNWKIRGAGRDVTTLRLVASYQGRNTVIATHHSGVNGVEVSDLTVDCNARGIGGALTLQAVALGGSHHKIQRVRAINAAGDIGEGFVIFIGGNAVPSRGNLIEDCEVSQWQGGACTAIGMSSNNQNGTDTTGIIRGNRVVGTQIGYGGWGMSDVIFEGNYSEGRSYGVNIDSLRNKRVVFRGNKFLANANYGVVLFNCQDCLLENNLIQTSQGASGILLGGADNGTALRDNELRLAAGATSGYGIVASPGASSGILLDGNRVDAGLINSVPASASAASSGNTDFEGHALTDFGNNVVVPTGQAGTLLVGENNLSDVADRAAARRNLALGTLSQQDSSAVAITGGQISLSNPSAKMRLENFGLLTVGGPGYGRLEVGANDGTYCHIRTIDNDRALFLGASNNKGVVLRNGVAVTYDSASPALTTIRTTADSRFAEFKDYNLRVTAYIDADGTYVGPNLQRGTGSPENAATGRVGDLYQRVDGAPGSALYVKESATGAAGWKRVATVGGTVLSSAAVLDFPPVSPGSSQDLTITCTGARPGASVGLGLPPSPTAGVFYDARVSSPEVVTIRAHNYTSALIDPTAGSFRVTVYSE